MHFSIIFRLVTGLTVCLAMAGCGGQNKVTGPEDATSRAQILSTLRASPEIYGVVTLDGPVSGAEVSVFRLDGSLIARTTSDGAGHYSVIAANPPPDYRIAAAGGNYRSKPVSGTLYSEIRGRPYYGQYAPVNPVTTLASLQVQRGANFADAEVATRKFFGIPTSSDLGYDLKPDRFSGRLFSLTLEARGSIASTMGLLLTELAAGQTHLFQQRVLKGGEDDIALFVAKGVLSGVLGQIGGDAFSSVMGALGLGSDSGAADAAAQMAKLDEIANAVSALSVKLDNVQNVLLSKIDQQAYITALGQDVKQLTDSNNYIGHELQALLLSPDNSLRRAQLNDYILKTLVQGGMERWSSALYGQSTRESSLIVMWSKVVQQLNLTLYDDQQSAAVQAQWDYFDAQQARSLAYVTDYMRSQPEYGIQSDILPLIERWRANRKLQLGLIRGNSRTVDTFAYPSGITVTTELTPFAKPLVSGLVIDRATGKIWTKAPASLSLSNLTQLDAYVMSDIQQYQIASGLQGWHVPSLSEIPNSSAAGRLTGLVALGLSFPGDARVLLSNRLNDGSTRLNLSQAFTVVPSLYQSILVQGPYFFCLTNPVASQWSPLLLDSVSAKLYRFLGLSAAEFCPGYVDFFSGDLVSYPASQSEIEVHVILTNQVTASDYWYN